LLAPLTNQQKHWRQFPGQLLKSATHHLTARENSHMILAEVIEVWLLYHLDVEPPWPSTSLAIPRAPLPLRAKGLYLVINSSVKVTRSTTSPSTSLSRRNHLEFQAEFWRSRELKN
jgi:hypothetical protein